MTNMRNLRLLITAVATHCRVGALCALWMLACTVAARGQVINITSPVQIIEFIGFNDVADSAFIPLQDQDIFLNPGATLTINFMFQGEYLRVQDTLIGETESINFNVLGNIQQSPPIMVPTMMYDLDYKFALINDVGEVQNNPVVGSAAGGNAGRLDQATVNAINLNGTADPGGDPDEHVELNLTDSSFSFSGMQLMVTAPASLPTPWEIQEVRLQVDADSFTRVPVYELTNTSGGLIDWFNGTNWDRGEVPNGDVAVRIGPNVPNTILSLDGMSPNISILEINTPNNINIGFPGVNINGLGGTGIVVNDGGTGPTDGHSLGFIGINGDLNVHFNKGTKLTIDGVFDSPGGSQVRVFGNGLPGQRLDLSGDNTHGGTTADNAVVNFNSPFAQGTLGSTAAAQNGGTIGLQFPPTPAHRFFIEAGSAITGNSARMGMLDANANLQAEDGAIIGREQDGSQEPAGIDKTKFSYGVGADLSENVTVGSASGGYRGIYGVGTGDYTFSGGITVQGNAEFGALGSRSLTLTGPVTFGTSATDTMTFNTGTTILTDPANSFVVDPNPIGAQQTIFFADTGTTWTFGPNATFQTNTSDGQPTPVDFTGPGEYEFVNSAIIRIDDAGVVAGNFYVARSTSDLGLNLAALGSVFLNERDGANTMRSMQLTGELGVGKSLATGIGSTANGSGTLAFNGQSATANSMRLGSATSDNGGNANSSADVTFDVAQDFEALSMFVANAFGAPNGASSASANVSITADTINTTGVEAIGSGQASGDGAEVNVQNVTFTATANEHTVDGLSVGQNIIQPLIPIPNAADSFGSISDVGAFYRYGQPIPPPGAGAGVVGPTLQVLNQFDVAPLAALGAAGTIDNALLHVERGSFRARRSLNIAPFEAFGDLMPVGLGQTDATVLFEDTQVEIEEGVDIAIANVEGADPASSTHGALQLVNTEMTVGGNVRAAINTGTQQVDALAAISLNPSFLDINGDLLLGEGATLEFGIEGLTRPALGMPGEHGAIDATNATLDGELVLEFDFAGVQLGDMFELIRLDPAGIFTSFFDDTTVMGLPAGLTAEASIVGSSLFASVIAAAGLTGDYNGDGKVDAADYVVWRKTNINGQQGYDDWRANFGRSAPGSGGGTAVPEPATPVLLGLAASLLLTARAARPCTHDRAAGRCTD